MSEPSGWSSIISTNTGPSVSGLCSVADEDGAAVTARKLLVMALYRTTQSSPVWKSGASARFVGLKHVFPSFVPTAAHVENKRKPRVALEFEFTVRVVIMERQSAPEVIPAQLGRGVFVIKGFARLRCGRGRLADL